VADGGEDVALVFHLFILTAAPRTLAADASPSASNGWMTPGPVGSKAALASMACHWGCPYLYQPETDHSTLEVNPFNLIIISFRAFLSDFIYLYLFPCHLTSMNQGVLNLGKFRSIQKAT
jgi:hypothetical protein